MKRSTPSWQKPVVTVSTPLNLYLFICYPTATMLISQTEQEIMFKKERRYEDDEVIPVRWVRRAFKDLKEFDVVKIKNTIGVIQYISKEMINILLSAENGHLVGVCISFGKYNHKFLVATAPKKRRER